MNMANVGNRVRVGALLTLSRFVLLMPVMTHACRQPRTTSAGDAPAIIALGLAH